MSYFLEKKRNRKYLSVFTVWSADDDPGEIHAIITILDLSDLLLKESLSTKVSFEARNGTWEAPVSMALMHSLRASKL